MDPFDEWVNSSSQHASVQKHADRLVELGASWDSFLSRAPDDIAKDLVQGGIPILAARDIVDVATRAAKQSQKPMAIFWDLENMPIPTTSSGRDVSSRLKSILKPYGDLVQFRGYASIGLNLIPQQKRSDLQLSGCLLVDCPHIGRKEVADKMIIVDAMNFAMLNPDGATLCFVTGDVDYAYLLAVLQRYKQYRTIVISKGTLQSMLDVNCDMKMRWETDILQLRSAPAWTKTRALALSVEDASVSTSSSAKIIEETFEPLTAIEEWVDDVEFLRNLVRREGGSLGIVRKSLVGNLLRQTNPARFPHREAVKSFLAEAIEKGVITETGDGAFKTVRLPDDETTGMFPAISLSGQIPVPLKCVPERVIKAAEESGRHYVIFVKWKFCPSGTTLPSSAFVQQKDSWGFLMFTTLTGAQRTVSEFPWLRNGTLVDWRKVTSDCGAKNDASIPGSGACTLCHSIRNDTEMQQLDGTDNGYACPECIAWRATATDEKNYAAEKVVELLQLMANNDDIYIAEGILRKQLYLKEKPECTSRKFTDLWIKYAIEKNLVLLVKHPNFKNKVLCLPDKLPQVNQPFPADNMDTSLEEDHILGLLWDNSGWIDRVVANESLRKSFPRMQHPYYRNKVFMNAYKKEKFVIAKSPYGQTVGLTSDDANLGLLSFRPANDSAAEADDDDTSDSEDEESECSTDEDDLRMLLKS